MKDLDWGFLLLGLSLCLMGTFFLFDRDYVDWRFGYVDLGSGHALFGFGVLLIGALVVVNEVRKRWRK